jgi:site-specific DNA recombinase
MVSQRSSRHDAARDSGPVRCAIYTRKSSEEGLDQDFNSLDAQREACAAYVLSQRHEGWTLVPDTFDDGGISGGHMNRPGLLRLLEDVKANRVDVIVVYKVDRLTRALSDFARIVEILDAAGASFVSITQSFNTTTSMGRLTLNVLLSFAQFEREVTGERIRDKIAASKKKGMWMGGTIPMGYDVENRRLVVNEQEAETVRTIMTRYLALGSVTALVSELAVLGVVSKRRVNRNGHVTGGTAYRRGALYALLANRLYLGETMHKGVAHPGEHDAIVDQVLWNEVQALLARNRVTRRHQGNANDPSLLTGMIRDSQGRRMSPRHAGKLHRRYRYYVSVPEEGQPGPSNSAIVRISAGEVEAAVVSAIVDVLGNPASVIAALAIGQSAAAQIDAAQRSAATLATEIETMSYLALREVLEVLQLQVVVDDHAITASLGRQPLAAHLGIVLSVDADGIADGRASIPTPKLLRRVGKEVRLTIAPQLSAATATRDGALVALIVKAHQARDLLVGQGAPVPSTAITSHRHLTRLARLSYLAPDIIVAILEGRQPRTITSRSLLRISGIPLSWHDQRTMLGIR